MMVSPPDSSFMTPTFRRSLSGLLEHGETA
jgi:hypothetical protein